MKTLAELRARFPQYDGVSDGDFLIGINRKLYPTVHPRKFLNAVQGAENAHATIRNDDLKAWYRERVQAPLDGETPEATALRVGGTAQGPVGEAPGAIESAIHGLAQGVTFGASDEIAAAMLAPTSDLSYDEALRFARDRMELGREANPVSAYGSEVLGALAMPAATLKGGAGLLGNALRSGGIAGAEGAIYGFNAGEGGFVNRAKNARDTGLISAGIGAAAPFVGAGAQAVLSRRAQNAAAKAAPSLDDMRAAAGAIYNQADTVTNLPRGQFATAAGGIVDDAIRKGMDADLTPGAAKVADRITDAANAVDPNIGFRELDILRKKAAVPAGNLGNRTESAIGSGMVDAIDDFVDNVDPALGEKIAEARDLWGRMRRTETVMNAVEKAKNAASGFENGLTIEFRRILNNPKLSRGLSAAERKAMEEVVRGSPFGNLIRQIGKMGIGLNRQSNGMGAMVGGLAGGSLLGPVGGLLFPAIGTVAKAGANAAKRRAADRAVGLIALGGQTPAVPEISGLLAGMLRRGALPGAVNLAQ